MSTITQFPSGNTRYRIEFDYLARTFVVVTLVNSSNPALNRVLEVGRDYRFLNPTMIEMLVDQSGFDIVRIHRQTGTDLVVDFRNGSVLTASDLTNAELQAIHIAEEGRDQTVDLAKEYADAAGNSAGNAKDSEDEARRIAESIKASGLLGYITRRSFEKGFNVTIWNEVLLWEEDGDYYRWDGGLPKNVPVGSTPETSGGVGLGAWVSVGDASLRADIANLYQPEQIYSAQKRETLSTVLSSRWANSGADKKKFVLTCHYYSQITMLFWRHTLTGRLFIRGHSVSGMMAKSILHMAQVTTQLRNVSLYFTQVKVNTYVSPDYYWRHRGKWFCGIRGIIVTNYYGSLKLFLDPTMVTYLSLISQQCPTAPRLAIQRYTKWVWALTVNVMLLRTSTRICINWFHGIFSVSCWIHHVNYYSLRVTSNYATSNLFSSRCFDHGIWWCLHYRNNCTSAYYLSGYKHLALMGTKWYRQYYPYSFYYCFDATGLMTSRIENQGVCYSNGQVFTFWIYINTTASNAYTIGILITQEYSNSPDLIFLGRLRYPRLRYCSNGFWVYPRILLQIWMELPTQLGYSFISATSITSASIDQTGPLPVRLCALLITLPVIPYLLGLSVYRLIAYPSIILTLVHYPKVELQLGLSVIKLYPNQNRFLSSINKVPHLHILLSYVVDRRYLRVLRLLYLYAIEYCHLRFRATDYYQNIHLYVHTQITLTIYAAQHYVWLKSSQRLVLLIRPTPVKNLPVSNLGSYPSCLGDVQIITYKWLSSIAGTGADSARWHFGYLPSKFVMPSYSMVSWYYLRSALLCRVGRSVSTSVRSSGYHCYYSWCRYRSYPSSGNRYYHTYYSCRSSLGHSSRSVFLVEAAYQRRRCDRIETRLTD
ncbi:peptidoglycan lytic exotransglycosylase [Escherichia virus ECG4]